MRRGQGVAPAAARMPPGQLEDHANIGFAIDSAAVEHSRLQDSIEATLEEFPVYLIGVAAPRIALILLRAQLRTDLCRARNNLGRKGVAGSDGIGGHCSLYANSRRQASLIARYRTWSPTPRCKLPAWPTPPRWKYLFLSPRRR